MNNNIKSSGLNPTSKVGNKTARIVPIVIWINGAGRKETKRVITPEITIKKRRVKQINTPSIARISSKTNQLIIIKLTVRHRAIMKLRTYPKVISTVEHNHYRL